jgi:chromosome segregation ATPase
MAAKTPASAEELRAELDRVRRESLRAEAERDRAEQYKERLAKREAEIAQVREQLQKALHAAEGQLTAAAAKIAEVSQPPPPSTAVRELDDARVRAARLHTELAEVRAERDDFKRQLEAARTEADGARASLATLQAAVAVRDTRADDAARAAQAALERAAAAEEEAGAARAAEERLVKNEEEARSMALGAQERFGDIKAELDQARDEIAGLRTDLQARANELASLRKQLASAHGDEALLRAEVEAERQQARARETQMVSEVHEREAHMVHEVREREAQLVAAAQAREVQLLAAAQLHEQQLAEDFKDASEQIAALTHLQAEARDREARLQQALNAAREREAALDAELRVVRGQHAEARGEIEEELDAVRSDLRRVLAEVEDLQEKQGRAVAHAAELQSVVDSLGRERAALRSEAGAMRAKVEMLSAADERSRRLAQELEELRGENEFLNQELARVSSPRQGAQPPLPKAPGA